MASKKKKIQNVEKSPAAVVKSQRRQWERAVADDTGSRTAAHSCWRWSNSHFHSLLAGRRLSLDLFTSRLSWQPGRHGGEDEVTRVRSEKPAANAGGRNRRWWKGVQHWTQLAQICSQHVHYLFFHPRLQWGSVASLIKKNVISCVFTVSL